MHFAYFITAYKQPSQLNWLFKAIYSPNDIFLVHIDRKTPNHVHKDLRAVCSNHPNVHFMPSETIAWGGWSLAAITLDAIKILLELDQHWEYFFNLSGQDYPIKSTEFMRQQLRLEKSRNYIQMRRISNDPPKFRRHILRRLRWRCFESHGRLVRTPMPLLRPKGLEIEWRGSFWAILTREFCDWLSRDPIVSECEGFLQHVKIPDEVLFQTLISNSPYMNSLISDNKREILWTGQSGPKVLTIKDYEILRSSRAFFARKFDEAVDQTILSKLADDIGVVNVE